MNWRETHRFGNAGKYQPAALLIELRKLLFDASHTILYKNRISESQRVCFAPGKGPSLVYKQADFLAFAVNQQ